MKVNFSHAGGIATLVPAMLLAACGHRGGVKEPPSGSFRFVDPSPPRRVAGGTMAPAVQPLTRFVAAAPIGELAQPEYPASARAAGEILPVTVGVRITIDPEGRVSEVAPSLAAFSTPTPFAAEFRAAVEAAVARWRFQPAEVLHLETVSDPGGDYQRLKFREPVEAVADVVFMFGADGAARSH